MSNWLFLGIAIFGEIIATSALKASDGFSKFTPSVVVVIGYIIAFYFLSLALRSIPVGVAYAIWAGLGVVCITVIAWIVYGQKLSFPTIAGMLLIVLGVVIMHVFSDSATH